MKTLVVYYSQSGHAQKGPKRREGLFGASAQTAGRQRELPARQILCLNKGPKRRRDRPGPAAA